MRTSSSRNSTILQREHGTIYRHGSFAAAVGYPAPYSAGASSLGAQYVYKMLNRVPDLSCARFFLLDDGTAEKPPMTLEFGRPMSDLHMIAFSISCEQELLGIVRLLRGGGIAPLSQDRSQNDPLIIAGGPLTLLDPRLVAPLADIVVIGPADHLLMPLGELLVSHRKGKSPLLEQAPALSPSIYIPSLHEAVPAKIEIPTPALPASAAVWSKDMELADLFLVEATRGCKRGCAFCTMSHKAKRTPCFHAFSVDDIMAEIPTDAPGVGLVGAAVTDHPEIERLTETIVESGRRVSLSSIRADKLTERLALSLRRGGLRTLTVAADGTSENLRRSIHKGISSEHIQGAADIAKHVGFLGLKIYSMVGLPGETDEDVVEFSDLLRSCASKIKVSATVQSFVPKPGTPLESAPMESVPILEHRLALLRRHTKGLVRILPTSPKWSYIDWKLAHGGFASARAAMLAEAEGGSFAAWKKAIATCIP
jgi:radical SAM superfamily enzyme YgiQ (UPF0313 family)